MEKKKKRIEDQELKTEIRVKFSGT
jgi:hypothetical protein